MTSERRKSTTPIMVKPGESLQDALTRMATERDEARRLAEEACARYNRTLKAANLTSVLRCAFCEAEYPPNTPPTQHEALTAHVMVCPKHPMRDIERRRDFLEDHYNSLIATLLGMATAWRSAVGEGLTDIASAQWRHAADRICETVRAYDVMGIADEAGR